MSKSFTEEVETWNRVVFGNISYRKSRIMKRLEGIDRRLNEEGNSHLVTLQRDLWKEYEDILVQEEIF